MQLDVTSDLKDLNEQLISVYARLNGDLTPIMQSIGAVLENSTRERFSTKIAPDGTSWAELLPSTIKSKNGRDNILVNKGDLVKSITYHASQDNMVVGTPEKSGKYHQDGTIYMEARPIFGISEDDSSEIMNQLNLFMAEVVNG